MTTAIDGDAVRDERGAVVQQALAVDEPDELAREPDALGDRGRRGRVGRRDDRAEHERGRPVEPGDDRVRDPATTTVVTSTSPTASREIAPMFARSSRSDVK